MVETVHIQILILLQVLLMVLLDQQDIMPAVLVVVEHQVVIQEVEQVEELME